MSPPDLPDTWQQLEDDQFPALAFLAAAAAISAVVGIAALIASPLILYRKLFK